MGGWDTVPTLTKANYQRWSFDLKTVLQAKGVAKHADGSVKYEDQDNEKDQEAWLEKDGKAKVIILRTLDDEHHAMVRDCGTSAEILSKVKDLFERSSIQTKQSAWKAFFGCHFVESMSVSAYAALLNQRKQALETLKEKVSNDQLIGKILDELPSRFESFLNAWNVAADTETIQNVTWDSLVKQLVAVEDRLQQKDSEPCKSAPGGETSLLPVGSALKANDMRCHGCGGTGHFKRECPSRQGNGSQSSAGKNQKKKRKKKEKTEQTAESAETRAGLVALSSDAKSDGGNLFRKLLPSSDQSAFKSDVRVNRFLLDSGASAHMVGDIGLFSAYEVLSKAVPVKIADDSRLMAVGRGTIACEVYDGNRWNPLELQDVLYIPGFGSSALVSAGVIADRGCDIVMRKDAVTILYDKKPVVTGKRRGKSLFELLIRVKRQATHEARAALVALSANCDLRTWHERFAHADPQKIKSMIGKDVVVGLKVRDTADFFCAGCQFGKMTRSKFKSAKKRNCLPGENLHSDLCTFSVSSFSGYKYYIVIKDESSGYR